MRGIFRLYGAGLALFALPTIAAASGITYDCDTAANHFSELVLPAGPVPFTVSGNVQLNALAGSADYVPMARIQIATPAAPGQPPKDFAGISVSELPMNAKKTPSGEPAIQMLGFNASGKKDDVLPLSILSKPGAAQSFTLSYDGDKVSVDFGTEIRSFPMKTAEPVVRIVCSTGEFLFTDLTIKPLK